jgi:hypothetical protein
MLLSVDEGHHLGARNSLVPKTIMDLGGNGGITATGELQACG